MQWDERIEKIEAPMVGELMGCILMMKMIEHLDYFARHHRHRMIAVLPMP